MKKYYSTLLLILFLPSLAYAAWWNPSTWFSGNTSYSSYPVTQQTDLSTKKPTATTPVEKKTSPKKSVPKAIPAILNPTRPQQQPIASTPPPNTTLCNGTYWKQCPEGADFVCPASGSAYCQPSQQQRANQINALTQQYNALKATLDQQIINLSNDPSINRAKQDIQDVQSDCKRMAAEGGASWPSLSVQGGEQGLLNSMCFSREANAQKALSNVLYAIGVQTRQIQLQEQQLYLDYSAKVNALR